MTEHTIRDTRCVPASTDTIGRAAKFLRQGHLVAFPTETVYGLGADADNAAAVQSLFAAKGRPADHPVIVHLADASQLAAWDIQIPEQARLLAAAFWPGPLTMILRRSRRASDLVTGGLETVGLRVPGHPVAQALLREFGGAIAAPSANRFGRVSPTQAKHVVDELHGRVDLILDGGPCQVGLESTIIDLSSSQPAVLRPGGITAEQIATVLQQSVGSSSEGAPRVSGALASHYAPRARVELLKEANLLIRAAQLTAAGQRVGVLASPALAVPPSVIHLPLPADDAEIAHTLYASLRQADELGCDVVLASLPEARGIGAAIADRLRKAAGPRDPV
jgi:L-threonylcarbamoyladenylate synthase